MGIPNCALHLWEALDPHFNRIDSQTATEQRRPTGSLAKRCDCADDEDVSKAPVIHLHVVIYEAVAHYIPKRKQK